jgi:hypothetical protein
MKSLQDIALADVLLGDHQFFRKGIALDRGDQIFGPRQTGIGTDQDPLSDRLLPSGFLAARKALGTPSTQVCSARKQVFPPNSVTSVDMDFCKENRLETR